MSLLLLFDGQPFTVGQRTSPIDLEVKDTAIFLDGKDSEIQLEVKNTDVYLDSK
jgi:hypothetical protein